MQKPLNQHLPYDLIHEGGLYYATYRDRASAVAHATKIGGEVRDYWVDVLRINRADRRDVEWRKAENGFSVWADPDKPPFDPVHEKVEQALLSLNQAFQARFGQHF